MTANQRRPGFRLPWSPDSEGAEGDETVATVAPSAEQPADEASGATNGASEAAAPPAEAGGQEFMRDLVAAMRGVADEAREAGVSELRTHADEEVHRLEADAQRRQADLRERAEADVNAVGEWAAAETERIKTEAEQRVVARRAQLDQQLAADSTRTDGETKA